MRTKWWSILIILLVRIGGGLTQAADSGVVVSIAPIKSLISQLSNGKITASQLVSSNSTPHVFSPKPSQIRALSKADFLVLMGFGLEQHWGEDLILAANNPHLHVITLSDVATPLGDPTNPHTWMSPRQVIPMTALLQQQLKLDPARKDELQTKLAAIDKHFTEEFKTIQNKKFIAARPAFDYIAHDYNLEQMDHIVGLHGDKPSPKKILQTIQLIKRDNVAVLLGIAQARDQFIKIIEEETNIKVVLIDPFGKTDGDTLDLMEKNLEKILNAFKNN